MGFLPFGNKGGQRMTRWPWLVLAWLCIIAASLFGSCMIGYVLVGDWRSSAFDGLTMGVLFSMWFTAYGLTLPVQKLPPMSNCR